MLRFGSAVGKLHVDQRTYTAIGAVIAAGRRVGRFSFALEYSYLHLQDPGPAETSYGRLQDLALVGRVDVLRLGPEIIGANSMVAFYGEGVIEQSAYHYDQPSYGDDPRAVPEDNSRAKAAVGFGAMLDHRLEQPLGFPNRFGWTLGWRLATSPRDSHDPMVACRGCLASMQPEMTSRIYDTELIVTSTLDFTW
ncbi:MAG TPA: hypothetical protein VL463_28425 [Kofleriaceae bacterium]|nr:hypothetical protein [Kofleriaceae bacterium]